MDVRYELDGNTFVWNEAKAHANRRKHGIGFEEAASVFFDPLLVVIDASRMGESRQAVIGFDVSARLLFVMHVEVEGQCECLRLISARRATAAEEARYAD